MITLQQITEALHLEVLSSGWLLTRTVAGGYAADLLSCAMHRAKKDFLWVTLQSHMNVVAVASLLGLSAVIVTEGTRPDPEMVRRAEDEGVVLLGTSQTTFAVVSRLASLGIEDLSE